jgi:hypothetical protein
VGDGEKLLTYLNSALKVLSGLDIFPRGTKKKLNFVDQCNSLPNSGKHCEREGCLLDEFTDTLVES